MCIYPRLRSGDWKKFINVGNSDLWLTDDLLCNAKLICDRDNDRHPSGAMLL